MSVKGIKTENSLVRKYNKKATFCNKNIPRLKKYSKGEIYIKETIPLPLSGGSLPEIVPLLGDIATPPLVGNLSISKCKSQQFSFSRKAAIFWKSLEKTDKQPRNFRVGVWSKNRLLLLLEPFQKKVPHHPKMRAKESLLVTKELESGIEEGSHPKSICEKR